MSFWPASLHISAIRPTAPIPMPHGPVALEPNFPHGGAALCLPLLRYRQISEDGSPSVNISSCTINRSSTGRSLPVIALRHCQWERRQIQNHPPLARDKSEPSKAVVRHV